MVQVAENTLTQELYETVKSFAGIDPALILILGREGPEDVKVFPAPDTKPTGPGTIDSINISPIHFASVTGQDDVKGTCYYLYCDHTGCRYICYPCGGQAEK